MISQLTLLQALCVGILGQCAYLVLARCYATGFLGSIGLGFVGVAVGTVGWESVVLGVEYRLVPQAVLLLAGVFLYLSQVIWRVIHFARLMAVQHHPEKSPQLELAFGSLARRQQPQARRRA